MEDKATYIYLGRIGNYDLKVSLPVTENMVEFNISEDYILDIVKKIGAEEFDKKDIGEELAISDEDKNCMIILSVKKDFLGLDYITPREKINE